MLRSIAFQRIHETLRQSGDKKSAFYRSIAEGLFTQPVKIGVRSAAHPVHEVEAILGARLNGATPEQLRKLVADLMEKRKAYLPEQLRAPTLANRTES